MESKPSSSSAEQQPEQPSPPRQLPVEVFKEMLQYLTTLARTATASHARDTEPAAGTQAALEFNQDAELLKNSAQGAGWTEGDLTTPVQFSNFIISYVGGNVVRRVFKGSHWLDIVYDVRAAANQLKTDLESRKIILIGDHNKDVVFGDLERLLGECDRAPRGCAE